MTTTTPSPSFSTLADAGSFAAVAEEWDALVTAMPRPSPFLLHGWIAEWWRHYGAGAELAVHVARSDGRLVAALPFCVRRRLGVRVAEFLGAPHSALGDLLVGGAEQPLVAETLVRRSVADGYDLVDLFGLPGGSRLAAAASSYGLRLLERVEAPVLDLERGWEETYRDKTSAKRRNLHKRRRRQLSELGRLEVSVAGTLTALEPALEEAFVLHRLRFAGRPDASDFATERGASFQRAALRALAPLGVPRITTLRLDGRAVAFLYSLVVRDVMYVHRLAFDPALERYSPGLLAVLDGIESAAADGARRVEFLGGGERYKLELADRLDPLYLGIGLASGVRGRAAAVARVAAERVRARAKRSPRLRRLYFDALAPARRLSSRRRSASSG